MKKLLLLICLLFPIGVSAQLTLPQGGIGTSTVPLNYLLIGGTSPLRITAVATSSLGLQSLLKLGAGTVNSTAGNVLYATPTSTPTVISPLTYSGTLGSFVGGTGGTFACASCLTANQTITLSGDVSGSGSTAITTAIGANKVTVGMLAQATANTILGNPTGATANIQAFATSSLFAGTAGQNAYFSGTGTLIGTSSLFTSTASYIGIGTTTPNDLLSLAGSSGTPGGVQFSVNNNNASGDSRFGLTNSNGSGIFAQMTGSNYPVPSTGAFFTTGTLNALGFVTNGDVSSGGSTYTYFNTGGFQAANERMRITAAGNVGIGTTTPGFLLTVAGTLGMIGPGANSAILVSNSGTGGRQYDLISTNNSGIGGGGNLIIFDEGHLGNGTGNGNVFQISSAGALSLSSHITQSATGNYLCINTSTFEVTRGNGSTCTTSDSRFKKNIQPLADVSGLAAIEQLKPVSFNWRSTTEATTTQLGFIAQDVQKIFPDLVNDNGTATITNTDGSTTTISHSLSLNYNGLIPVTVKAIQELNDKINVQQAEIDALKIQVDSLINK